MQVYLHHLPLRMCKNLGWRSSWIVFDEWFLISKLFALEGFTFIFQFVQGIVGLFCENLSYKCAQVVVPAPNKQNCNSAFR